MRVRVPAVLLCCAIAAAAADPATTAAVAAAAGPRVIVHTPRGDIHLALFPQTAPATVANFISLAKAKFYDGTAFHRVEPGFVIQGGCPNSRAGATGTPGTGNAGYNIKAEVGPSNTEKHVPGTLAMARSQALDSASCQFYVTLATTPHLDGAYTVFGRVLSAQDLEVCKHIQRGDRMTVDVIDAP